MNGFDENLRSRIKQECLAIRTVGDLEQYAQQLPPPIGAFFFDAVQFFSIPCIKIVDGIQKTDRGEVNKRREFGSYFLWEKDTVITKKMCWPLSAYIASHPQFRSLIASSAVRLSEVAGYGSDPMAVMQEIEQQLYESAPYLSEKYLQKQVERVRGENPDKQWTKKELRSRLLLDLLKKHQLPFLITNGWKNPNWEHREVQELVRQFDQFSYLLS